MRIVDPDTMKVLDKKSIDEYGVPGIVLMENAGRSVVDAIMDRYPRVLGKRVSIFCGRGNNGGDGFVVARHLRNRGVAVHLCLLSEVDGVRGDAAINLKIWRNMGEEVNTILSRQDIERHKKDIVHSSLIVDAIFGTGLSKEPEGIFGDVIDLINSLNLPVVSIDIPSGLDGRTGMAIGRSVKADMTVTMALPKIGLVVYPGLDYAGRLIVADIGMPHNLLEEEDFRYHLIDESMIKGVIKRRRGDTHKGDAGHLLVIAGSRGKTGAAALTSLSGLRAGAGLVTLALPASLNPIMEEKLTEVMTCPVDETGEAVISFDAINDIKGLLHTRNAIAIGPGLTPHPDIKRLVIELIRESSIPIVIDADGINSLVGETDILKEARSPCILTPHPGEMARLISSTPDDVQSRRIDVAKEFALEHRVYLVLKGARTVIADPEGTIYINTTGNPGMATAGTGDVLTGVIAGLLCQGYSALQATIVGVYIHGKAGDAVADEKGVRGMIAGDIMERIPYVVKDFLTHQ